MKRSNSKLDLKNSVHLKYVKLGYSYLTSRRFLLCLLISPVILQKFIFSYSRYDALFLALLSGVIAFVCHDSSPRPTYLLDFACYRPPSHLKISNDEFIESAQKSGNFSDESIEFQRQVLENSGIGDQSCMPRSIFQTDYNVSLRDRREEAAAAMFGPINGVLATTKVRPEDIGILVVNCGGLNTTPSLASMVVNHYKLGTNVQSFNLGGMGCSAGVISVEVARDLLRAHSSVTYALVVSVEVVSSTWYKGDDLDKLVPNCYLRTGAAAVLLSGSRRHRWRAKYELGGLRRSISTGQSTAIRVAEDDKGMRGISVGTDLVEAIVSTLSIRVIEPSFEHVCVSAMGRKVLDGVQARLGLSDGKMEASRKTLERFGNTSSSSVWYALAYLEHVGKVKARDRVWQIAFGSGIKCNTLLWKALRNNNSASHSPWG